MKPQHVRDNFVQELPFLLQKDKNFRRVVLRITRKQVAVQKTETESRFDRLMALLEEKIAEDRKQWAEVQQQLNALRVGVSTLKTDVSTLKVDVSALKVDVNVLKADVSELKVDVSTLKVDVSALKADVNVLKVDVSALKADVNVLKADVNVLKTDVQRLDRKFEQTMGALGTRWGLHSEAAFRNALAGILKDVSGVEVIRILDYDDEGLVFGRPEQIDLDLIIQDGLLIIAELKASVTKSDVHYFDRKVQFYEKKHTRLATRKLIISPQVDQYAVPLARKLGIEIFSYVEEVKL
jgi:hypothetical protein